MALGRRRGKKEKWLQKGAAGGEEHFGERRERLSECAERRLRTKKGTSIKKAFFSVTRLMKSGLIQVWKK